MEHPPFPSATLQHRDIELAKHVIGIHKSGTVPASKRKAQKKAGDDQLLDIPALKAYIDYCKHKCFPRLDAQAKQTLQDFYVQAKKSANQLSDGAQVCVRVGVGRGSEGGHCGGERG